MTDFDVEGHILTNGFARVLPSFHRTRCSLSSESQCWPMLGTDTTAQSLPMVRLEAGSPILLWDMGQTKVTHTDWVSVTKTFLSPLPWLLIHRI